MHWVQPQPQASYEPEELQGVSVGLERLRETCVLSLLYISFSPEMPHRFQVEVVIILLFH